jgi:hypothetical protein
MQTENTDYLYPATSTCWVCGSVQLNTDRTIAFRRCSYGHEEVTWKESLPTDQTPPALATAYPTSYGHANRSWHQTLRDLRDGPQSIDPMPAA